MNTKLQTAVVTGGGSGIGRAFVHELAKERVRVVVSDIDDARAEQVALEVRDAGGTAIARRCDVASKEQMSGLADFAHAEFGEINLIVNNAGVGAGGRVGEVSLEDWEWTLGINLWGVIYGCHYFLPRMRTRRQGAIINVASAAGFAAAPFMAPYNVTKAGVVSLSETLAAELHGCGISVTVLCPTFVRTNILDQTRGPGKANEFARKLMAWTGVSPESVAKQTLRANARGELYVVPQLDARALWRLKRRAPAAFTRVWGFLGSLGQLD